MKRLKKILAIFLCVMMMTGASSCIMRNDSSSASEGATTGKMSQEKWITAFDFLCTTNNVTLDMFYYEMDNDLNPIYSFKQLTKIADGDKYYVHRYETLKYTSDGVINEENKEEYVGKIDGVNYHYEKEWLTGIWQRTKYPLEMTYLLDTAGIEMWVNAYDEMSYNEETGVYRLENKVIKTDDTIPRTMYYMEVEVRDGKIYRIEHEGDMVKYDIMGMDVVWRLDGRYRTISLHYDYGTTEVVLPEIEE